MTKRIVWITGAGKGIGRALALELAKSGDVVVASARTATDLETLIEEARAIGGAVHAFALDITDASAARTVVEQIEAEVGPIDVAVLNAGTHAEISGTRFDLDTFRRVIDTNLCGSANCLAAVLPLLVSRRKGHVAVVASLAGYRGLPTAGAYAASKAGLMALCEALQPELASAGVRTPAHQPWLCRHTPDAPQQFRHAVSDHAGTGRPDNCARPDLEALRDRLPLADGAVDAALAPIALSAAVSDHAGHGARSANLTTSHRSHPASRLADGQRPAYP